jgi:DNA repair ATPase RecN
MRWGCASAACGSRHGAQGANRADLCARFSLKDTPAAQRWLEENQLEAGVSVYFAA